MPILLAKMKTWAYNNFNIEYLLDGVIYERIIKNGCGSQGFHYFSG